MAADETGLKLPNGCRITHGQGATIKQPFADMSLTMHELSAGGGDRKAFRGQLGFIEFTPEHRLPRHIHMDAGATRLVDERILVLHGVGLVELAGSLYVAAPGTLVDAVGGVPHTWTACPAGVRLPDGYVSQGRFTMVYEYEEPTVFFPTASTDVVTDVNQYRKYEGSSLEEIRFPRLTKEEVVDRAKVVFDRRVHALTVA